MLICKFHVIQLKYQDKFILEYIWLNKKQELQGSSPEKWGVGYP